MGLHLCNSDLWRLFHLWRSPQQYSTSRPWPWLLPFMYHLIMRVHTSNPIQIRKKQESAEIRVPDFRPMEDRHPCPFLGSRCMAAGVSSGIRAHYEPSTVGTGEQPLSLSGADKSKLFLYGHKMVPPVWRSSARLRMNHIHFFRLCGKR